MKKLLSTLVFIFSNIVAFSQITLTSTVSNASCWGAANGSATVSATGGTAAYSYTWIPSNTHSNVITGLAAGSYTVIVQDAVASTNSLVVIIGEPTQLTAVATVTNATCGQANGALCVNTTGGTGAYTSLWSNGATTSCINLIPAGVYTYTVMDINGCIRSSSVSVSNIAGPIVSISSQTNVSCFGGCNGIATTSVSGTPPYIYNWSNGQVSASATNLCAGMHTVSVTDQAGCIGITSIVITQPTQLNAIVNSNNVKCFGTATGTIAVSAMGGTPPYNYVWPTIASTLPVVQNVTAGNYPVTVTDINGCSTSNTVTVIQPTQLNAIVSSTNASCLGACDGSGNVVSFGGSGAYTFSWNNTPTITTALATNLCPGTYTIIVTDANNCSFMSTVYVGQSSSLVASTTATPSSCGQSNGAVCANITGGTLPVTFLWNNLSATSCISNIPAGAYSYTVTDSNGCTTIASGLVNDISGPVVSVSSQTHVTCFGLTNGAANLNVTGGSSPYTFAWSGAQTSTTSSASNLGAGIHNIVVTDMNGCIGTQSVLISQPQQITTNMSFTNASCGMCNGQVYATVMGGTPGYIYTWSPSAAGNNAVLNNLCQGVYAFQVTDSQGCTETSTVNIASIGSGSISGISSSLTHTDETCLNLNDGSIDLTISGSNSGPFTYQWSNGATSQDVFNLPASYYSVTIFDSAMNCFIMGDTVKTDGTNCGSISGKVFIDNNSDCIYNSGDNNFNNVQILINPGSRLGYTNLNGDYIINNLPYGTYTITANTNTTYSATCSTVQTSTINAGSPNSINNNFTKEYIPITQPDLYVSSWSQGIVPGFVCRVNYLLYNYNTFSANGTFKATLPSAFIPNITNVYPASYTLSGDTILWNFTNISYTGWSPNFYVDFTTPLTTPLGSMFTTCMWAQPTVTDANYANNNVCYSRTVNGSFDPNDKTVSPVGIGANGDIAATETDLTYLIRFQNTGNGPAVNIVVKDTLSPNVDINTFEMLGSSHTYNIDIMNGNVLRWKFNNIMLPDSNSNEPGSHGYIHYRIKRNSNNSPGTQIKNTAYIYFDFNEPVVTNTAINTIETITGIQSQNNADDQWSVYPNPSTGILNIVTNNISTNSKLHIQVANAVGQLVLEENSNTNYKTMDMTKLSNGVYFVKLVSDKQSSVKRIVLSK